MTNPKSFWSHPLAIIGYLITPAILFYILMVVPIDTIQGNRGFAVLCLIIGALISSVCFIAAGKITTIDSITASQRKWRIIFIVGLGLVLQFVFSAVCIFTPILFK